MLELKKVAKLVGVLVDADLIFVSTSILYMLSESDSIHIQNMTAHMQKKYRNSLDEKNLLKIQKKS